MKLHVTGKEAAHLERKALEAGFSIVEDSTADLIVSYGGDGTLIGAERRWPGVPKLGMRADHSCIKCARHDDHEMLRRLRAGELEVQELMKLKVQFGDLQLLAMNDVIVRNADPRAAVRFAVSLNDQPVTEEMIGDGLVACTPFGSSAYFRSITRTVIRTGIGIAFNNCTDVLNHLVVREDEIVTVRINRGPGTLASDNDDDSVRVDEGAVFRIGRADETSSILAVDALRCGDCRYVHAPRRRY